MDFDEAFEVFDNSDQSNLNKHSRKKTVIHEEDLDSEAADVDDIQDVKKAKLELSADEPITKKMNHGLSNQNDKKLQHEPMETEQKPEFLSDQQTVVEEEMTTKDANELELIKSILPRICKKEIEVPDTSGCTHYVAYPEEHYFIPLEPISQMVKTYNFTLDLFQERAIQCVDNYQSVLVSAHTSAGKTAVAEYAVAKGLKDNQRVIYTTPIKALSNQKYREFNELFKDVGLVTGDVTINPSASCLIMTTEILRNMLYRGSEIMREVGWVIFDEVHYMKDPERGVVWEETIILLPHKTHYVFLSATIPNAMQFAEWVAYLHRQPCNVIYTDFRPVPLHHYIYPEGADALALVVDEKGRFKESNFNKAIGMVTSTENFNRKVASDESPVHKLVKLAMDRKLSPMIVFSFSKKDCENYAMQLSKLDFNTVEDKLMVNEIFKNAIDVLSKDDQNLPQVNNLLPLLKRGIGIHHGGLLPLLKETIEILFAEGLIRVLFATETFAMGLNMPARTVVFTNTRKFDGKNYRWITSGEYIQMSGRAGRRGIDEKGLSIVVMDEKVSSAIGKALFKGQADPINSQFHLTYNMVLNLIRVEEINPEYMMERSFSQFQNYNLIPNIIEKVKTLQEAADKMHIDREEEVASYCEIRKKLSDLKIRFRSFAMLPKYVVPYLQPGRLVCVSQKGVLIGWAALMNFHRKINLREDPTASEPCYVLDVLIAVDSELSYDMHGQFKCLRPPRNNSFVKVDIVSITLKLVEYISSIRVDCPKDLIDESNRIAVYEGMKAAINSFPQGLPLLDPVKDMGIRDKEFHEIVRSIKMYEERMVVHNISKHPSCKDLYQLYLEKSQVMEELKESKKALKQVKSLLHMDELKSRKRVLRRLGYCNDDDVIELKGRVACEITSGDELLLTELMFNGIFLELDTARTVSLLSCLVFDERSNETARLTEELSGPLKMMQDIARQIAKVCKDAKLEIDEEAYVDSFKPSLMDVVYAWCKGANFAKLLEKTSIFEGSIIRCMRRLEELLRQLSMAAKVIGNKDLENKFSEGVKLIKRDIVFAASLYI